MLILCHLIQKQPAKPPKNSVLHKLLNQRKSHAIQNTHTQNCKEKAVAIQKLALGIVAELKQTVGMEGWVWEVGHVVGFFIVGGPQNLTRRSNLPIQFSNNFSEENSFFLFCIMRFLMSGFLLLVVQPREIFDRKLANPQNPPWKKKCNTGRNAKKREETRIGQARCVQKSTFQSLNALDMHEEESLYDVRSPWKSREKNPKNPSSQTPKITTHKTHKTQATERYEKEKCERERVWVVREREFCANIHKNSGLEAKAWRSIEQAKEWKQQNH
jgi:hypothetical protein